METFEFLCLDPRKKKRIWISSTLSGIGSITWCRFAPMSLRGYRETKARAESAVESARTKTGSRLFRKARIAIFSLQYNGSRAIFSANSKLVAVCWNGLNGTRRAFMDGAKDAGAKQLFFELAPFPDRITVDPCGVNFANCLPRNIEPYLQWFATSGLQPDAWRVLGQNIQQRRALKTAPVVKQPKPDLSEPFLFVPLQTPGDSQLRLFGGNFKTVETFVDAIGQAALALPKGWHIRVKEHPTATTSFADLIGSYYKNGVILDNFTDTFTQVAASRGVVTVNSSVGLETMFFDKPVIACGKCFWAIEGVANYASGISELKSIFASPDQLCFDENARIAFLSFLSAEYYIKTVKVQLKDEGEKVRRRIKDSAIVKAE